MWAFFFKYTNLFNSHNNSVRKVLCYYLFLVGEDPDNSNLSRIIT